MARYMIGSVAVGASSACAAGEPAVAGAAARARRCRGDLVSRGMAWPWAALVALLLLIGPGVPGVEAQVLRVPRDYPTIQAAIDAAAGGQEIIVADGVYSGRGFFNITFRGKAVTVRSENGPSRTTLDANFQGAIFLFQSGELSGSVVDGFTLLRGSRTEGGAIFADRSSPTIRNCIFVQGRSGYHGGGVGCINGASPRIENCQFIDGLAGIGAGVSAIRSKPIIVGSTFINNRVDLFGGGAVSATEGSLVTIDRSIFRGNIAGGFAGYGGAVNANNSVVIITNSLLTGNFAQDGGGAVSSANGSAVSVIHSTVTGNTGGASGGGVRGGSDRPRVIGSILRGNTPEQIQSEGTIASVSYSNIEGGFPGTGNIDADARFTNPAAGDFTLTAGSPCIDAGDWSSIPAAAAGLDLAGRARRVDDPATPDTGRGPAPNADMGAYEFQPPVVPVCAANCTGDRDPSGRPRLDVADFACFQNLFALGCP